MKIIIINLFFLCISMYAISQGNEQEFIKSDIANFWEAYDKINSTKDTTAQREYLKKLFIDRGTPGLKGMMEVRNYTENEYLGYITSNPEFWSSIRGNTNSVEMVYPEIRSALQKLKEHYPRLAPVPIYFTIGAFRSGGTTHGQKVLIGSELSLADANVKTGELPDRLKWFFKSYKPRQNIALLCVHEYIHTQQKPSGGNLLSDCLREGIAEFVSCNVTGLRSNSPAIEFGKANRELIVSQFNKDLFLMSNNSNWLWGENRNHLKERDLGYYIGYEMAERYYQKSINKTNAIRHLIELDFTNETSVEELVDASGLLPKKLDELYEDYQKQRPTVIKITPEINGAKKVRPGLTKITIEFSEPLNGYNTGIDFGPLGADYFPKLNPSRVWSADNKSITIEADLKPGRQYQFLIDNTFRKQDGVRLKAYLLDFVTE
jgi:hypothetical protein